MNVNEYIYMFRKIIHGGLIIPTGLARGGNRQDVVNSSSAPFQLGKWRSQLDNFQSSVFAANLRCIRCRQK